ncbi:MAG: hypothetical protein JOZ10_04380 [Acidobacteria bacterium]|nr:hypothetical protein [Acidobacteriota bacterium]
MSPIFAFASSLASATRAVIPEDVQQIINVDYRSMEDSESGQALKARVLPEQLKKFETALKGVGINPDKDVDQLTFASFRVKSGLQVIGIAQGDFASNKVVAKLKTKKIKPATYRDSAMYPLDGGLSMTLLDNYNMLFGDSAAMKSALDVRDGVGSSLNSNSQITDMISSVDSDAIWSVLDEKGTQEMMKSALGEASQLADYNTIKNRIKTSAYKMDFGNGVKFNLNVNTSDAFTAASLKTLLQAGILYKKMNASPTEKVALENLVVDSDSGALKLKFETDDRKFISLVNSDIFTAISK